MCVCTLAKDAHDIIMRQCAKVITKLRALPRVGEKERERFRFDAAIDSSGANLTDSAACDGS